MKNRLTVFMILVSCNLSCGANDRANKINSFERSRTSKNKARPITKGQIKSILKSYERIDAAVFHYSKYADVSTMKRQIFDNLLSGICKLHRDPKSDGIGYSRLDGIRCPILWINEKNLTTWNSQELIGTFNKQYDVFDTKFGALNDIDGYELVSDVHKKVIEGNSLAGKSTFLRNKKGFLHSQTFGKIEIDQLDDLVSSYGPRRPNLWEGKKIITLKFEDSIEQVHAEFNGAVELYELNGVIVTDKELQKLIKSF